MTEALRPWIREAQNGSTEAVEFILEQFHPLICKHSRKNRHHYDSMDEARSTALDLGKGSGPLLHAFDLNSDEDAPRAFNRTIQSWFRRESRQNQVYWARVEKNIAGEDAATDLPPIIDELAPDPHHYMDFVGLRDALELHLSRLSERERRFLHLRYAADMTLAAIAALHGLSASQVCKVIKAAEHKLKSAMTAQEYKDISP